MSYLVVQPDGSIDRHDQAPNGALIREALGGYLAPVHLASQHRLAAFVDDDGDSRRLPRNPVGAVIMMILGAPVAPYRGPVVLTGWCPRRELLPLDVDQLRGLYVLHSDVRAALDGTTSHTPVEWTAAIRDAALLATGRPRPAMRATGVPFTDQL